MTTFHEGTKARIFTAAMVAALAIPSAARAQDVCEAAAPLDDGRYLRRLSLDLKGAAPSYAEIEAAKQGPVGEAAVDAMLRSEDFVEVMRAYHASLLWPNIDETMLVPDTHMLYPYELAPGEVVYMSPVRSVFVRTAGNGALFVPCKNEPVELDANGNIVAEPLMQGGEIAAYVEGWVEVEPYWAPGTTVRVCAFDAQPNASAVVCPGPVERYPFAEPTCQQFSQFATAVQAPFRGEMVDCDTRTAILAPECGCGPNLQHCQTPETAAATRLSLLEQELRILDDVVRANRPYHEALITPRVEFNGPIVHYLKYQSRLNFDVEGAPDPTAQHPENMQYDQTDEWQPIVRSGRHSGILTTPGYLLRFTTWRGRAHRFYNAFECSSFIPNGPLPSPQDPCSEHEDLTKRCGCDACHQALEPMAAHWGRFSEFGYRYLDDASFPRLGVQCTPPLDSVDQLIDCFRQYELDPVGEEVPFRGQLNAYVFRTEEQVENVEEGPRKLVEASLASGRMSDCTVRKMWTHFMRREPTLEESAKVLPELSGGFAQSGYDIRTLVKQIVLHPAYRRAP